jgi:hypothetical protein
MVSFPGPVSCVCGRHLIGEVPQSVFRVRSRGPVGVLGTGCSRAVGGPGVNLAAARIKAMRAGTFERLWGVAMIH